MALRLGRALAHRNYRLFFVGQSVSLIGTWLTRFATVWMAYRLTHSGVVLGLVGFFGQAPSSIIAPIAGVLVDRWDRHRVIVVTQIAALLQSAVLALFAFTGWMTVYHLMVLGAIQAVINAFDMPARQSFLGQMIEDRADLPNAIALNSSIVNATRLIGPVIAAELVSWFGEGWCFAIDSASYLAVIASLLAMRVAKRPAAGRRGAVLDEMRDGWHYVLGTPVIKAVLLLLAVSSVLGGSYSTLLPLVARDPHTLGILMGAGGLGALAGALFLANRASTHGFGTIIARCTVGLGCGMIAIRFAPVPWGAAPIIFVIGASLMIQMAATNTIIQTTVDPGRLGRVMSLYAVAFFGGAPVGALTLGTLADRIGPLDAFTCAGVVTLGAALVFARTLPNLRATVRKAKPTVEPPHD